MKFALTVFVGVLAALGFGVAADTVTADGPPDQVILKLFGRDRSQPEIACDNSQTVVQNRGIFKRLGDMLGFESAKTPTECTDSGKKRASPTPDDNTTTALASIFSDPSTEVNFNMTEGPLATTSATDTGRLAARDVSSHKVHMRWGGRRQHVGQKDVGELMQNIWDEVNKLCPGGTFGHVCDNKKEGKIRDIGNAWKGDWHAHGGAYLKVWVPMAYWPYGYAGMREALMELAPWLFASEKNVRYCHIPGWGLVSINHKAWMTVRIQLNGKTNEQFGGCEHTKKMVQSKGFEGKANKLFKDAIRTPIDAEYHCYNDQGYEWFQ
ncbi:hypothetical protein K458DRAFT_383830 [Lentithecium fluviatile CBS 122367]|uniref:Ecp2 effector protein domain-containing protein n=1 Tax=Lentithecium fluviatile CBS 122367 TaxID=1168545 RepID=A0A6G1JF46_9PLEO|nr:hypothetical protein K458DRAFT_383830 [Lentithecium fluviatile CBS 122367]